MNNILIKIITSYPIILLTLYFIPFIGVCLLIFRFIISSKSKLSISLTLLLFGFILLIPQIISKIFTFFHINTNIIIYLDDILKSSFYQVNILKYSKLLFTIGFIFLILTLLLQFLFTKFNNILSSKIISYLNQSEQDYKQIAKENDLEMKIKQEKAKTTNHIKCPYCGADNLISSKVGKCQYCRRQLENITK